DQTVAQVELRGAKRRLGLIDAALQSRELRRRDVRLHLSRPRLYNGGVCAAQGMAALLEPNAGLRKLMPPGEYLPFTRSDVAAQRVDFGCRFTIRRRAVIALLNRHVARGRQP